MDSLGDRMKKYEKVFSFYLPPRMPILFRLDGASFHTYSKSLKKPFDEWLMGTMARTMLYLCKEVPGAVLGYTQSDEISLLVMYYQRLESEPWFANRLEKLISHTAGKASAFFTQSLLSDNIVIFDSRTWTIPQEDVPNYFIWRWQDWVRNSLNMFAQAHFSNKELLNKNKNNIHEMLYQKGLNWADLSEEEKNGTVCVKNGDWEPKPAPSTMEDWRNLVEPLVNI